MACLDPIRCCPQPLRSRPSPPASPGPARRRRGRWLLELWRRSCRRVIGRGWGRGRIVGLIDGRRRVGVGLARTALGRTTLARSGRATLGRTALGRTTLVLRGELLDAAADLVPDLGDLVGVLAVGPGVGRLPHVLHGALDLVLVVGDRLLCLVAQALELVSESHRDPFRCWSAQPPAKPSPYAWPVN